MSEPLIELFRGSAQAWECDENDHLNVRTYIRRAWEGAAALAARLHLPAAFTAEAASTIAPLRQHVRFLREVRNNAPIAVFGGVLESGESDAKFYQEMRHGDGAPAATFVTDVAHIQPRGGAAFPWSRRTREAFTAHLRALPEHGAPRSLTETAREPEIGAARADALDLIGVGRGAFDMSECDAGGRIRPDVITARISDSMPNLLRLWRDDESDGRGAIMLEFRVFYRAWPRAGDLYELRSAYLPGTEKTLRLVHWLLDPVSGEPWASAAGVSALFDRAARKIVEPSARERKALKSLTRRDGRA